MATRRPRWYQFSLRSLLVLITVGAIWITVYRARIGRHRATVHALEKAGATLQFTGPPGSLLPERVKGVSVPPEAKAAEIIRLAKGLRDLSILGLSGSDVQDDDLRIVQTYPALTTIHISSTDITEKGLSRLHSVKTLKTVYVGKTFLAPEAIRALESAVPGCRVIGKTLQPLTDTQKETIRKIFKSGGSVSYDAAGHVRSIRWDPLDEKKLALIARFPTIQHMGQYARPQVTDAWLKSIGRISGLKTLRIGGPKVSDEGLSQLAELTKLQDLDIEVGAVTGENVTPFKAMPSLHSLSIQGAQLTSIAFVDATSYEGLETLTLRCPKLASLRFLDWSSLKELRRLELEVNGEVLAAVTLPKTVQRIVFSRMSLDAASFLCLDKVDSLESLVLRDSKLSSDAWAALEKLSPNGYLNLQGTPPTEDRELAEKLAAFQRVGIINVKLTDAHLTGLAAMPALTRLSIVRCDLSAADVTKLGKCTMLKNLYIRNSQISSDREEALRNLLRQCEVHVNR